MARKGKEPAGLRRYRLAQKRKKAGRKRTVRAAPKRRRTMARRRRKGRGKKQKSIAVLPILPVVMVAKDAYDKAGGLNTNMANRMVEDMTGYNMLGGTFSASAATPFWLGEVAAIVVHKVANKTGVNKYIRKFTMGYLTL